MDTRLLERAARDRALSPKALGLLTRCLAIGRVVPIEDLIEGRSEGREYVRSGMAELRQRGYIISTRMQDPASGRWVTMQEFGSPKSGFPEFGESHDLHSLLAIELIAPIPTPNGVGIGPRVAEMTEVQEIKYSEIFGSTQIPDGPKETRIQRSAREVRLEKPAHEWTSHDVTEEFAYRVRQQYPDKALGQVGGPHLNKILGSWIRDKRITAAELAAALDLFFSDPRLLHDLGKGHPAWKRFLSYIPTARSQIRVKARLEAPAGETSDEEAEQTAQKALRRLSE